MKKNMRLGFLLLSLVIVVGQTSSAQGSLLRKIQNRTEDEIVKGIFGDKNKSDDPSAQPAQNDTQGGDYSSESGMSNTKGAGLTNTKIDVLENIADAETAFQKQSYPESRNSVKQAILGVEIEIGRNILKGMPGSVKGMDAVTDEDEVSSMSIGFVGLTINRNYRSSDQELRITIGNDAALMSGLNLYMNSANYSGSDEQDFKQVKFKEYQGILEFDENSGYKLSVPFGQSSIFIADGMNFKDEQEIMAAAEEFDLEKIKTELGE